MAQGVNDWRDGVGKGIKGEVVVFFAAKCLPMMGLVYII